MSRVPNEVRRPEAFIDRESGPPAMRRPIAFRAQLLYDPCKGAQPTEQSREAEQHDPQGQISVDPIAAHNFAKSGLSFYTVEALQRFANVRHCPIHLHMVRCVLWVPGQNEIDHDRPPNGVSDLLL